MWTGALLVDTVAQTITAGGNVYEYSVGGSRVTIAYPDGSSYFQNEGGVSGLIGDLTTDYSNSPYLDGEVLMQAISAESKSAGNEKNYFLALLAILAGVVHIIAPKGMWFLSHGWKYKNAELSEAALFFYRAGGVVAAVIALLYMIL